jgi:hypothetical protein
MLPPAGLLRAVLRSIARARRSVLRSVLAMAPRRSARQQKRQPPVPAQQADGPGLPSASCTPATPWDPELAAKQKRIGLAGARTFRSDRLCGYHELLADNPRAAEVRDALCRAARSSFSLREHNGSLQRAMTPNNWFVVSGRYFTSKPCVLLPYHATADRKCEWCGGKQKVDELHKCRCALWSKIEVDVSTMHWGTNRSTAPLPVPGLMRDTCVVVAPTIAAGGMHTVLLVAPCDLGAGAPPGERGVYALHALPEGHEVVVYTGDVLTPADAQKGQAATLVDMGVKVVTGSVSTVVIRPVPLALCSLFNHCCNPNMVCSVDREARALQWRRGTEILIDTPVLTVVRDVRECEELSWSYFYGQGKKEAGGPRSIKCLCSVCREPGAEPNWLFTWYSKHHQ